MTAIQARAMDRARQKCLRAKKEREHCKLYETRYRGVRTVKNNDWLMVGPIAGTLTYRGVPYTKN